MTHININKMETINQIDLKDKGIFTFVTLNNINIYIVYKQDKTTINDILETFKLNYDLGNMNTQLYFNTKSLNRPFNSLEINKTPNELKLPKIETIKLSLYDGSKFKLDDD